MFYKHLLSKKTYIVAIIISGLFLGVVQYHYYYVVRQNQILLEREKAFVQHIQAQKEEKFEVQKPIENSLIQQNKDDDTAGLDRITQFNKTGENTFLEKIPQPPSQSVGSMPKDPDLISWFEDNVTEEDIVNLIESDLKAQGIPVLKMHIDNGLVYPIIKNTLYVEWGTYTHQGRLVKYMRVFG